MYWDFTSDAAPWWYVAALAGSFTILGGLITWLGSFIAEQVKARRERRQRWDDQILERASSAVRIVLDLRRDVISAIPEFEAAAPAHFAYLSYTAKREFLQTLPSFTRALDKERELGQIVGGYQFIAPKEVRDAAGDFMGAVGNQLWYFDPSRNNWLKNRVNDANDRFRSVVRKHFGI